MKGGGQKAYRNKEKRQEQNDHKRVCGHHFVIWVCGPFVSCIFYCIIPLPKYRNAVAKPTHTNPTLQILPFSYRMARATSFAARIFVLQCALVAGMKGGQGQSP